MTRGEEIIRIGESITKKEVGEIVEILQDCGAALPLAVWSAGFRNVINGELVGGIPDGHVGYFSSFGEAAFQYVFLNKLLISTPNTSDDVCRIVLPHRIIDATGKQILPK